MTLEEAFEEFINSDTFKEIAKRQDVPEGVRYRQYKKRFSEKKLGTGAIVDLLRANGYIIYADRVERK